jgi:trk system potassium uptake protein TrkH
MRIEYKSKRIERFTIAVNVITGGLVAASFILLFGFKEPVFSGPILHAAQLALLTVFIVEELVRAVNAAKIREYLRAFWYQLPLSLGLIIVLIGAGRWFAVDSSELVRHAAVGVYLILQMVFRVCRTIVNLAASGQNPTRTLILSFLALVVVGAGILMLPRSVKGEELSFVDALFTSTSAVCVTGLVVRDTGKDFTLMGQGVILTLIQLGGLGIVTFGAIFALLLGQALSVRESVAMQDLLSSQTAGRIGRILAFIFVSTLVIEGVGALIIFGMWNEVSGVTLPLEQRWWYSVFHSISAFCNAGFGLFDTSFTRYSGSWQLYAAICPLIILGGLGFGVLFDLWRFFIEFLRRVFRRFFDPNGRLTARAPGRMQLQTKIVVTVSAVLIVVGALLLYVLSRGAGYESTGGPMGVFEAFFQSITARTVGFNTVDIGSMGEAGRFVLMLLMFIGGSPGSTAGGIKTVTFVVLIMTAVAAIRKRSEVEIFRRAVRIVVVGRAITITLLFIVVLFTAILALSITEDGNGFTLSEIAFEATSALGTVGLTTGITGSLTSAGKLIIIIVMLIGRLGPLTLLAELTFNLKPAKFNYAEEALIVG